MSAAYFKAAIPEPYRILGLSLKPLSLGRYRLLNRFGVAFVSEQARQASISDLIFASCLCSMRCDAFLEWVESPSFGKDLRRWGRKVCPWPWINKLPWIGKYWRKHHTFDVREKFVLFKRYIAEGSKVPKYWDLSGGGEATASASHWSQNIEVTLRSELGWTSEEINEAPLTKAISDFFKFAENNGSIQLTTEEEDGLV